MGYSAWSIISQSPTTAPKQNFPSYQAPILLSKSPIPKPQFGNNQEKGERRWLLLGELSTPLVSGSGKPAKPWIALAAASRETTISKNNVIFQYPFRLIFHVILPVSCSRRYFYECPSKDLEIQLR